MPYRVGVIVALLCVTAAEPVWAQGAAENLLANPDLARNIEGWGSHEGTKLQWEAERGKAAPGSLMVPGQGGRQAAVQDIKLATPCNCLEFSGWSYCERLDGVGPTVALDLGITLDNGQLVWFVPMGARLAKSGADWQQLTGRYLAPEGRSVVSLKFFCLNYRNSAPAWFDDLSLWASQLRVEAAEVTILAAMSAEGKQREAHLRSAADMMLDKPIATSPLVPSVDECKLLLVPEWENNDRFLEQVKTFCYLGGRVALADLPTKGTGLAMWYWLFDGVRKDQMVTDSSGMAVAWTPGHQPSSKQLGEAVSKLLATELQLPPAPQPFAAWSAPKLSFDEHAVYLNGEPRLLFAAGAYSVGADWTDPATDMAEFAELGMNAVVLYVNTAYSVEDLCEILDAAHEYGLHCLLYLRHGRGTHHPGRPWRAEWIAKFSVLAGHPAFLAWLTGDDVFARHQDMMIRTRELIRHYDKRGLICMTLMDLRRPEHSEPGHWRRWDQAFDFPVPYVYTLQRGEGFATGSAMLGGLIDLQRLGDNADKCFPQMPHFQWVQAHMQQDMWKKLGLAVEERWLPTPEQQALLLLHALAGGADGLLYFTHLSITVQAGGLGRRWQLKILHHQLKPISRILLLGNRQHLEVEGEAAATLFDTGAQAVVLVRRVHQFDQAQVNVGSPVMVTLKLPEKFEGTSLVRITPLATSEPLTVLDAKLTLEGFAGWEIVAHSANQEDLAGWNAALQQDSAALREATVEMLRDTYLKTQAVMQVLDRANLTSPGARELMARFAALEAFVPAGDLAAHEFMQVAEARRGLLGQVQERHLAEAAAFWAARSQQPLPEAARTFYGLPHFYQQAGTKLDYEPGLMGKMIEASGSQGADKER